MNNHPIHPDDIDFKSISEPGSTGHGELRAFFRALQRQKFFILIFFIVCSVIVGAAVLLIPSRYESDATILLQPVGNIAEPNDANAQASPEIVRSQLEVAQSQGVIERVVDRLELMNDPDYAPTGSLLKGDADTQRAAVLSNVAKRLAVDNDGRSVSIHIRFQARSPQKAAKITDALASEYIRTQGELKNRAVKLTQDRLDSRLADLRLQALQSEQAADDYRRSQGLVWLSAGPEGAQDPGASTYTSRLLSEFSRQAAGLSATAAEADARAQQASADMVRTGGASTPEGLSSSVIASLLQQDADLAKTESSMESRYTTTYPPLVQVRAQRAELKRNLNATRLNIERSLTMQADSAEAADHAASARATALEGVVSDQTAKSVHYDQLKREAAIARKTYEDFAIQSGAISERSLLQLPDAVLVSPASLPIKAIWPNRPLFIMMGCIAALVLGCAAALARELRRSRAL